MNIYLLGKPNVQAIFSLLMYRTTQISVRVGRKTFQNYSFCKWYFSYHNVYAAVDIMLRKCILVFPTTLGNSIDEFGGQIGFCLLLNLPSLLDSFSAYPFALGRRVLRSTIGSTISKEECAKLEEGIGAILTLPHGDATLSLIHTGKL